MDVEYPGMQDAQDLETHNVPVTALSPLRRPPVRSGMTLQRQFSGLVSFNPEEEEQEAPEEPTQMLRRVQSGHANQYQLLLSSNSHQNSPRVAITRGSTLLQAVTQLFEELSSSGTSPWDCSYTIQFEPCYAVEGEEHKRPGMQSSSTADLLSPRTITIPQSHWESTLEAWQLPAHIPGDSEGLRCAIGLLKLIQSSEIQFGAKKLTHRSGLFASLSDVSLQPSDYLTGKLHQQLQDCVTLCSQAWPQWCLSLPAYLPQLISQEERHSFFFRTAFGVSRAVHFTQEHELANDPQRFRMGQLRSCKVTLTRANAGDEAVAILKKYASRPDKLVFEYSDAASVGSGVHQDFFTLAAQALRRPALGLWLEPEAQESCGLFPTALPSQPEKVLEWFRHLGRLIARSLMEQHLLDIPLSLPMYMVLCGQPITADQLHLVDSVFARSLADLMRMEPSRLASLELHFDELEEFGYSADQVVTAENRQVYASATASRVLHSRVQKQLQAMLEGVNQCFPVERLAVFQPSELKSLVEGDGELKGDDWTVEELAKAIEPGAGTSADDPVYQAALRYLADATNDARRAFLRFTTSSPQLPVGGLRLLKPKLTIVTNQVPEGWVASQQDSVPLSTSTCEHILRIPPYSCEQVLFDWLHAASFNEHAQYFKDNA